MTHSLLFLVQLIEQVRCSQIFSLCGLALAIKMTTTAALTHMVSPLEYQTKSHFSTTDLSCLLVEGHQCLSHFFDRHLETHVQPTFGFFFHKKVQKAVSSEQHPNCI